MFAVIKIVCIFDLSKTKNMKATLKINYAEATKGQTFRVVEIQGKRVTLDINGRKIDFGFSEVELSATSDAEYFSLGRELDIVFGGKSQQYIDNKLRGCGIEDLLNYVTYPVKKTVARLALNKYVFNGYC